jgi:hypothetical protein
MNELGDLTTVEYRLLLLGTRYRPDRRDNGTTYLSASNSFLPDKVDWRDKGYVTGVKNQGMVPCVDLYIQAGRFNLKFKANFPTALACL